VLAIAVLAIGGCPGKGPKMVKVTGVVKFKDGTPLPTVQPGGAAVITFVPADMGDEPQSEAKGDKERVHKGASGKIKPDGSFELTTVKPGDGVIPGRYKVIVVIRDVSPAGVTLLIPQRYADPNTSGFGVIEIDKSRSDLVFELDKQ
jgi:hypothetical protein